MSWELTRGLQNLRTQVNAVFPDRDKTSDGTIGDAAHQAETSGHNPDDTAGSKPAWDGDSDGTPEVRAWDMDSDLGDSGVSAQALVNHLRTLSGLASVIRYMIYNRTMYHERDGFAPTAYTGSSAHTEHVHFEGAWTNAADANTAFDYQLGDLVALTADDKAWITSTVQTAVDRRVGDVIPRVDSAGVDIPTSDPNPTIVAATAFQKLMRDTALIRVALRADVVDEPAIIAGVLAGLPAEAIAAAIPADLAQRVADELAARLAA